MKKETFLNKYTIITLLALLSCGEEKSIYRNKCPIENYYALCVIVDNRQILTVDTFDIFKISDSLKVIKALCYSLERSQRELRDCRNISNEMPQIKYNQ